MYIARSAIKFRSAQNGRDVIVTVGLCSRKVKHSSSVFQYRYVRACTRERNVGYVHTQHGEQSSNTGKFRSDFRPTTNERPRTVCRVQSPSGFLVFPIIFNSFLVNLSNSLDWKYRTVSPIARFVPSLKTNAQQMRNAKCEMHSDYCFWNSNPLCLHFVRY